MLGWEKSSLIMCPEEMTMFCPSKTLAGRMTSSCEESFIESFLLVRNERNLPIHLPATP